MAFRDNRSEKFQFNYRKSDPSKVKERASQSGGKFDPLFKEGIPVFSPKPGKNYDVRIMPPGWDNAEGYNFELWVHYSVGPDNQRYVCLQKMKNEPCPCCEEVLNFQRSGDNELADKLKAKKRQVPYVIDRDHESDGPQIWPAAWTTDKAVAAVCIDERSGEIIYLDDPNDGFDLQFKCEKKGDFTEIIGIKTARNPSPLSDDPKQQRQWLRFITENAIPDCVQYYSYEHIKKVLEGGKVRDDEDSDEDEKPNRGITRSERQARDSRRTPADRERVKQDKRRSLDSDSIDRTREELDEDDELDEPPPKRNGRRRDDLDDERDSEPSSRRKVSQNRRDEAMEDDESDEEERPMRRR